MLAADQGHVAPLLTQVYERALERRFLGEEQGRLDELQDVRARACKAGVGKPNVLHVDDSPDVVQAFSAKGIARVFARVDHLQVLLERLPLQA